MIKLTYFIWWVVLLFEMYKVHHMDYSNYFSYFDMNHKQIHVISRAVISIHGIENYLIIELNYFIDTRTIHFFMLEVEKFLLEYSLLELYHNVWQIIRIDIVIQTRNSYYLGYIVNLYQISLIVLNRIYELINVVIKRQFSKSTSQMLKSTIFPRKTLSL